MSGTCKEWLADIGCKSALDKEQYTHLVWCAALASKVENFTSTNTASLKLPSWFDLTKDIAYKSPEELYAAKEIYSRIVSACQLQA